MTIDVDRELAEAQLQALVKIPGALKVITAEHACGIPAVRGQAMPSDPEHQEACVAFQEEVPLSNPNHFVIHDVVEVTEANGGRLRAITAEGDWTEGQPMALLNRLQQWRT